MRNYVLCESLWKFDRFRMEFDLAYILLQDHVQIQIEDSVYLYGYWWDQPQWYLILERMKALDKKFCKLDYRKSNKYFKGVL